MPRTALTFPRRKTVENLLTNGDFEYAPPFTATQTTAGTFINGTATGSASNNSPYIWGFQKGNTATAQFDSTVSKFGTNSLKVTTGSSTAYGEVNLYGPFVLATTKNTLIPALPNTAYTISWWMKTEYVSGDASQGATVGLIEYNGIPGSTTFNSGTTIKTTTDWTYYSYTVTTQSTTRFFNVQPRIYGHNGTGTLQMNAWFDYITLVKSPVQTRTANTFPQRKTPNNLLSNGNFESVPTFTAATNTANRYIDGTAAGLNATEFPYRWFAPGTFANATAQYDTSVKLTGTASMKLSTTTTAGLASALYGNNTSATNIKLTMIPVLPSTSYTVSGYCKTNNVAAAAAHIDIYEYNGTGTLGATNTTNTLTGTNDWTLVTKTFTTASTARYLSLALRNHVAGNVSDAWFDDITLTKTYPFKSTRSLVDNTVIYNGNFEYVPTGTIATTSGGGWIDGTASGATNKGEFGWVIFNYTGSWAAKFDTTEKYSGAASMKISTTAVSSTIGVGVQEASAVSNQINNMPITPNTSYTLSIKMKTLVNSGSATTGAYLQVIGYKVDGFSVASGFTGPTSSTAIKTTTDWTYYSITFTTSSSAGYLRPELRITGNNGTGTLIMDAWFDDITIVKN